MIFFCTTDTEVKVHGYQFNFEYDTNELAYLNHENFGKTVFSERYRTYDSYFENKSDEGRLNTFAVKAERGAPMETLMADTTTSLGTFTFEVLEGAVLDGASDFSLFDFNYAGIYEGTNTITPNLAPALDHVTDVGGTSAVPVPAAAWLLGSSLLGLMGIRRKNA